MWSKKYCDNNKNYPLVDTISNFIDYIQFHKIPASILMSEVYPLKLVHHDIIMRAIAYQVRLLIQKSNCKQLKSLHCF